MRTFLRLKNRQTRKLPPEFQHDDLRYPDELVATFLRQFTQPGNIVFDPFAGYGTTLIAAEAMDRVPWGVEFDARRVRYIRSQLQRPANLIHGDSRQLLTYQLPAFDLSITSPPFMEKEDIENPFTNYTSPGNGYAAYLRDLQQIYTQVKQLMKPRARVILEVANLKRAGTVTTLAWDIANTLAAVLHFEGEIVIGWDSYGFGYDHSYCLLFSSPSA
jgi:DNA modification methylase